MQLTKQSYNHAYAYLRQARANIILAMHTINGDRELHDHMEFVKLDLEKVMGHTHSLGLDAP